MAEILCGYLVDWEPYQNQTPGVVMGRWVARRGGQIGEAQAWGASPEGAALRAARQQNAYAALVRFLEAHA